MSMRSHAAAAMQNFYRNWGRGSATSTVSWVLVVLFLVHLYCLPTGIAVLQYESVSNYFPSCLDITDVYPYPHSILKPVGEYEGHSVYTIQVTFSKAITYYTRTKMSTFVLAPLLTEKKLDVIRTYTTLSKGH